MSFYGGIGRVGSRIGSKLVTKINGRNEKTIDKISGAFTARSTITPPCFVVQPHKRLFSTNISGYKRTIISSRKESFFPSQLNFKRNCSCSRHKDIDNMCSSVKVNGREVLPSKVKPVHYEVTLEPDLEKYTFKGTVDIELEVKENTKSVTVNSLELELSDIKIESNNVIQEVDDLEFDKEQQTVEFSFANELIKGNTAKLSIAFVGELNDKLAGFYRSIHTDENGKTRVVATTQMEATDCRRAFPCFDEPSLKATFGISLIHDKDLTALSNMDIKSVKDLDGARKITSFNKSPIMSTYLVAFIVGEFSYVESNYFRVPVRVYATPGMEERCKFSAELGARTLEFFEKKFDVPYPLPKMDMVGIHDFSAGAMENWGLVTYRVVDLLFDEENDNANTKQRVAEVVQHELAHQWFGNLVTMDWWDGLWLNEGFATWMSWYSCNSFYPDWKVWETYVGDNLQSCLALDSLRSSHPVEVPVKRADEVNQIFDAISYSKGSCIVKMASILLGEETFIKGISRYLKRHQYGNTETGDLWKALSEESGKDVASIMDTWTSKVGFPVLTVKEEENGKIINVKQNRFLSTGDVKPEEDTTIYPLSLGLRTKDNVEDIPLADREINLDLSKYTKADENNQYFYKLNADQAGIYRTLYPQETLIKLSKAAVEGLLTAEDRVGLVADTASLAVSGYQKTSALLDLVSLWKDEKEANVWNEMLARLSAIRHTWIFESESTTNSLKKLLGALTVPKLKTLGYTFTSDEPLLQQQLKGNLFASAIASENQEFINIALDLFKQYANGDEKAIHPNIKGAVFGAAAKYGDEATWKRLVDVYKSPKAAVDGLTAITAVGQAKDIELQKKTMKLALDGTVRSQDVFYVLRGLAANVNGINIRWDWLRNEWDTIVEKFPPTMNMLSNIISICAGSLATPKQLEEFDTFFNNKDTKGFDKAVSISRDRLVSRIAWLERDGKDVEQWLNKYESKL